MSKFIQKTPLNKLLESIPQVGTDIDVLIGAIHSAGTTLVSSPSPENAESYKYALVQLGEYVARDAQPLVNEIKDVYASMRMAQNGKASSFDLSAHSS